MHAFDRQTDRQTDGQTDGRTDRNLIARPRLHCMQRGKKVITFQSTMTKKVVSFLRKKIG